MQIVAGGILLTRAMLAGALLALVNGAANAGSDHAHDSTDRLGLPYPHGTLPGEAFDPFGYSLYRSASFSPSGILYPPAVDVPWLAPVSDSEAPPGWRIAGFIELGWLFNNGDTRAADFREFSDFDSGPLLSRFEINARDGASGDRLRIAGVRPGRDDQRLTLSYQQPGRFEIGAGYDAIPHVFEDDARVLFEGIGRSRLTLPRGLIPGQNSAGTIRDSLLAGRASKVALQRRKASLFGDFELSDALAASLHANTEWRDGERPFGGAFAYPTLGQSAETIEPINYVTHEIDARLALTRPWLQLNLAYAGSVFINDSDTLVWENPGLSLFPPEFVVERGRTALAPDNRFHQFSADLAANLPVLRARWTLNLAWNRKRQNDELLPPTISSGAASINGTPVDLDLWNTVAALSQQRADARIHTGLIQTELSLNPIKRLRASFKLRYLDEDNDTDFTTFNPLTGQFGTIRVDGGTVFDDGIFQPGVAGELIRLRTAPHATDELDFSATFDLRLARRTRLEARLGLERRERPLRERETTRDQIARLQLTDRSGPWASLRLAVEAARRTGSDFNPAVLDPLTSAVLPGFVPLFGDQRQPLQLRELREFELASRDRHVIDGQLRFNPGTYNDIALAGRFDDEDFEAGFGLRARQRASLNAQWSRQLARDGNAWIHYSYQRFDLDTRGINDAGPTAGDESAGGPVFPLANLWRQSLDETNHAAGAGLNWQWGRVRLQADYTFSHARSERGATFAGRGALVAGVDPDPAAVGLPDQRFERHLLRASLRLPIRRHLGARLFWRFESERIRDPNFIGLNDPVVDNQLFLLARPEDFDAHLFGVVLEIDGNLSPRP